MFTDSPAFSSFSINDLATAKRFYGEMLGLSVSETDEGLQITLSKGGTVFLYPKVDHIPATFTVLNFTVDDIDAAVLKLKEKGIALEHYDTEMLQSDEQGIYRGKEAGNGPDVAWFKDPAGNILSVLEE